MYEILQLMKKQKFEKKIFPVILNDACIYSPEDRVDYIKYWHEKYAALNVKTVDLDLSSLPEIAQELKL